jgi:rhamnogalacturonyl hydrolase YesR
MADLVPAYWWASQHALTENDRHEYKKRALAQTRSIIKHNKMPDGFFAQSAIIDPSTHERITQENQDALSSLESVSRTQAMVLRGLMEDYHHTRDEGMLREARNLAEAFLKYMPVDSLPRSDLKSGKGAPPDSSTYVFAVKPLVELTKATNDPRYQEAARRMRRILVRDSLSTNTDSAGIIKHNCLSAKNDWYTDSSLIFVDYTFLTD